MIGRVLIRIALLGLTAAIAVSAARGQTTVATFAAVAGAVEVRRADKGEWQTVAIGSPLFASDAVRTATGAAAKLTFVDEAVLNVAPSTELTVVHYAAGKGPHRSLLRLTNGKIEALVTGYSGEEARYEVETPSAVARVQGTDFIVRYDAATKATDVAAIDGTVAVQGTTGIIGPGVAVGASEMTHVPRDGFPSPAKALDTAEVADLTQGLRLVGTGMREGLATDNPIVDGQVVDASDRPAGVAGAPAAAAGSYLRPGVPGQTLIDTLSPDIRANTQPLPVYRAVPPNDVPNPPH